MMEDFEQELLDQYALASAGLGATDAYVATERSMLFEFVRFLGRPLWTAEPADADRFLAHLRRDLKLAKSTSQNKARHWGEPMRWNLRMRAAEQGIWKSTELRRRLAEAGLEISAGKMSGLWTGTPTTIRLDDLEVICAVLECTPADLLICEPERVAARRPGKTAQAGGGAVVPITPRPGRHRSLPPA